MFLRCLFIFLVLISSVFAGLASDDKNHLLLFCLDAPGLNYASLKDFLLTMCKHPNTFNKEGRVGHAWICLLEEGKFDQLLEVGHSGELGIVQPKYFNGVLNLNASGYSDLLAPSQSRPYRFEPNPIKYLFDPLNDGFLQRGAGGHQPTSVFGVWISDAQKKKIFEVLSNYPKHIYSLCEYQCCGFIEQVAKSIGIHLTSNITIPIEREIISQGVSIRLWKDEEYSQITVKTVDHLCESLILALEAKLVEDRTGFYQKYIYRKKRKPLWKTISQFPKRYHNLKWLREAQSIY